MKIFLDDIVKATGAKIYSDLNLNFNGLGTDTRKDLKNRLFIALKGDNFDAHDFCSTAVKQGATGILIHRLPADLEILRKKITILVVKDTLLALQDWAHFARLQLKSQVVGITGSNGKTTAKEFSAAVLAPYRKVHYSKGSFNNHWGLPFSILDQPVDSEVSLFEMGMNHAGEIKRLCEIAEPDIVACTTVGRAHIEHFGSIEKIAEAKSEIYRYARPAAQRIYNLDNPLTLAMAKSAKSDFSKARRILLFSSQIESADVHLKIESITDRSLAVTGHIEGKRGKVSVPVFGSQNLGNLMLAASIGLACGLSAEEIWQTLPRCQTIWGRNQFLQTNNRGQILFDGYNANPDSVMALIANLPYLQAKNRVAVIGEMLELGTEAAASHREVGKMIGASGLDLICFFGAHQKEFAQGVAESGFVKKLIVASEFDETLAKQIVATLNPESIVVVKGSRGMKLERFVQLCEPRDFQKP